MFRWIFLDCLVVYASHKTVLLFREFVLKKMKKKADGKWAKIDVSILVTLGHVWSSNLLVGLSVAHSFHSYRMQDRRIFPWWWNEVRSQQQTARFINWTLQLFFITILTTQWISWNKWQIRVDDFFSQFFFFFFLFLLFFLHFFIFLLSFSFTLFKEHFKLVLFIEVHWLGSPSV